MKTIILFALLMMSAPASYGETISPADVKAMEAFAESHIQDWSQCRVRCNYVRDEVMAKCRKECLMEMIRSMIDLLQPPATMKEE